MQCECPERAPIPCDTSDLHAPCCAAQQLACVPGPKPRRETRDANAEEATGEKQLLRLERPFQTAVATYNVIQNARGFLTKQVMRCRARLTAPLGRAQPPLSTTPYQDMTYSGGHPRETLGPRAALGADANPQTPQWARHSGTPGTHNTLAFVAQCTNGPSMRHNQSSSASGRSGSGRMRCPL